MNPFKYFTKIRSTFRKHSRLNIPYAILILSIIGSAINVIYATFVLKAITLQKFGLLLFYGFSWTIPLFVLVYFWLEKEITFSIKNIKEGNIVDVEIFEKAKKRLKLRPLYASSLNFTLWFIAGLQNSIILYNSKILSMNDTIAMFIGISFLSNPVLSVLCYFLVEIMSRSDMRVLEINVNLENPQFSIRYKILFTMIFLSSLFIILLSTISINNMNQMIHSNSRIENHYTNHINNTIMISFVCIFYIIFAAFLISKSITDPIQLLSKAMKKVEQGEIFVKTSIISTDEVGGLMKGFNSMMIGLQERENIKKIFGHYVSSEIRDQILEGNFSDEGEEVIASILFCDIRGFTSISETLEPKKMILLLNEYFSEMVNVITENDGVIDKFIGDAVMAIFGGPKKVENSSISAIKAATKMLNSMQKLNDSFEERGLPQLKNGIGIATGKIVMGNIGSKDRKEFTVIGDVVNTASRLESLTRDYNPPILFNELTFIQSKTGKFVNELELKGKKEKVKIYTI